MVNLSTNIWDELDIDSPFNVHIVQRSEDASHIVGDDALAYLVQYKEMYKASLVNSTVTTIAGAPGTGKSYILTHLKYRMLIKGDMPGIPILMRLKGRSYDTKYVYHLIKKNDEYKKTCIDAGIITHDVAEEVLGQTILNEIGIIRFKKPDVSICLLVDNVDEYVRSNGLRYEESNKLGEDVAREKAMKDLLELFNGIIDTIRTGMLIVLSLTEDMVIVVTNIAGKDSSLLRRFSPIYESRISDKIHIFKGITLEDTFEMVAYNMKSWFERHKNFNQKELKECIYTRFNTYPFSIGSIKLLFEASEYPGEIILGCLSSVQRYIDVNKLQKGSDNNNQVQSTQDVITETYAALGILQMSDYFRNVSKTEGLKMKFIKRLIDIINKDSNILYNYTLPQIIERYKFEEVEISKNLGIPFLDFLGKLINGEDFRKVKSDKMFLRTRGKIKYPNLPILDCLFDYELAGNIGHKRFGVQFLFEESLALNTSKIYTSCSAIRAKGADKLQETDTLDAVIFICLFKNKNWFLNKVKDCFNPSNKDQCFINAQGKDYRTIVGLVEVDEEDAWKWKALAHTNYINENQKKELASLIDRIDYFTWIARNYEVNESKSEGKTWRDLINTLYNAEPYFPPDHIRPKIFPSSF